MQETQTEPGTPALQDQVAKPFSYCMAYHVACAMVVHMVDLRGWRPRFILCYASKMKIFK